MHGIYKFGLTALICGMLGGCASFVDPASRPKVISSEGLARDVKNASSSNVADLRYRFTQKATAAASNTPATTSQREFLHSGFALIYSDCNTYIESKSDRQRGLNVVRDSFAPVTALAIGLAGLLDNGDSIDNDYLTAIGLLTSAANSGFEVYEQRYLFSADNVESVRALVLQALIKNANLALANPNSEMNFEQSVIHLLNNQAICSPSKILQLVNGAIKAGTVSSRFVQSGGPASVTDKTALQVELAQNENALLNALITNGAIPQDALDAARAQLAEESTPAENGLDAVVTDVTVPEK